jgi:hypothetical protein
VHEIRTLDSRNMLGRALARLRPCANVVQPDLVHGKRAIVEPARLLSMTELMERVCVYYQCELTRAIQFASGRPMRSRANAGWAANRRQAAAMFV